MPDQDITAIIGAVWKRNHVLEQVQSLVGQTLKPRDIWVCQYGTHIDLASTMAECRRVAQEADVGLNFIHSEVNFKYFGPLTLPLFCETEFVFLLDDDVVVGRQWLEHCRAACTHYDAIIGAAGRIISRNLYRSDLTYDVRGLQKMVGDGKLIDTRHTRCAHDMEVDYLVNSKFLRTVWTRHAWATFPIMLDNGNDIHLSAACKTQAGIRTVVLKQTGIEDTGNLKPQYGWDCNATFFSRPNFKEERMRFLHHWIGEMGWQPVEWFTDGASDGERLSVTDTPVS